MGMYKEFIENEAGAVTVDYTVFVAGLVGLGFAVVSLILPSINNGANDIATSLSNTPTVWQVTMAGIGFDFWRDDSPPCDTAPCTQVNTLVITYEDSQGNEFSYEETYTDGVLSGTAWFDNDGNEMNAAFVNVPDDLPYLYEY